MRKIIAENRLKFLPGGEPGAVCDPFSGDVGPAQKEFPRLFRRRNGLEIDGERGDRLERFPVGRQRKERLFRKGDLITAGRQLQLPADGAEKFPILLAPCQSVFPVGELEAAGL